jgi:hypothetical protein
MKTSIFSLVNSGLLNPHILSFFIGLFVQVIGFDDHELELAQDLMLNGVLKDLLLGQKTSLFGTKHSLTYKLHNFKYCMQ